MRDAAAKQEAFEEASKLRNQFRPLDDNEVDFLETVKQKERNRTEAVRQETAEQLAAFRKEQAASEQDVDGNLVTTTKAGSEKAGDGSLWATSKKRRKPQVDRDVKGAKTRRLSEGREVSAVGTATETKVSSIDGPITSKNAVTKLDKTVTPNQEKGPTKPAGLALGYGTDSDSDG